MLKEKIMNAPESSNKNELQKLIESWMDDPSDHDERYYPDVQKELNDHRVKFSSLSENVTGIGYE